MRDWKRDLLVLLWTLAAAGPALAQGTITAGDAEFTRGASPWDTSPAADLRGVSTPLTQDHLFETGWWYRVAGDPQEFSFPTPDAQSYVGDASTATWSDVAARGLFSAVETSLVVTTEPVYGFPSGYVRMQLAITNLSAATPLELDLFHFADFDVDGPSNDSAALVEWGPAGNIEILDPSGNFAQYLAAGDWAGYLVTPFGGNDVAAQLSDAAITDFGNTGLPFPPADFVGGWQYSLTVPPGEAVSVQVFLMLNASGSCLDLFGVFCDGFPSGDTALWSLAVP
jgi:hypothetical protein